ncbi:MAG: SLC13 family permease [Planctomycetota bacterium]
MVDARRWAGQIVAGAVVVGVVSLVLSGVLDAVDMSDAAQVGLAIMVIAGVLWMTEAVPLFLTAFVVLGLALTWLMGALPDGSVAGATFTSPFFSNIILLFLGGFTLSAALHKQRLDERLARWVIQRAGGSMARLMLGVMVTTAFLSMWLSNTATAAMVLSIVLPITNSLPAGDRARTSLLLAVPFAANIGGVGTPIGSPPNAIALQYLAELDAVPGFAMWMAMAAPVLVVMLLAAWGLLLLLNGRRGEPLVINVPPVESKMSGRAWLTLLVTLLTMLGWLASGLHGLASGTVALLPVLAFFGLRVLDSKDFRGLSWDVLFMMGGGLCLGVVVMQSGLADWLVERLPTDSVGPIALAVIVGVLACGMSLMMSNTATANLILPIVIGLGLASPSPVLIGVAFSCSMAMALPISTPPNAIVFSSGQLSSRDLLLPGILLTGGGLAMTYTIGLLWWGVLGWSV